MWYQRRNTASRRASEIRQLSVDGFVRHVSVEQWLGGQPRNVEQYAQDIWYGVLILQLPHVCWPRCGGRAVLVVDLRANETPLSDVVPSAFPHSPYAWILCPAQSRR